MRMSRTDRTTLLRAAEQLTRDGHRSIGVELKQIVDRSYERQNASILKVAAGWDRYRIQPASFRRDRRQAHVRIGQWLEAVHPDGRKPISERTIRHYEKLHGYWTRNEVAADREFERWQYVPANRLGRWLQLERKTGRVNDDLGFNT